MCRLCEEMSRKVYTIDPTVLIPRKLYKKLSPILLIFVQGNFSFGVEKEPLNGTSSHSELKFSTKTYTDDNPFYDKNIYPLPVIRRRPIPYGA